MTAPILEDRRPRAARLVGFGLLLTAVALGLATFSALPWEASAPGTAMLKVAFRRVSAVEGGAHEELSREALERLPRHMRPQSPERSRTGRRRDTDLRVELDGRPLVGKTYRPSGLRHDGPTFAYEELAVAVGRHLLTATLADVRERAGQDAGRRWRLEREVDVRPGQVVLLEFTEEAGLTVR